MITVDKFMQKMLVMFSNERKKQEKLENEIFKFFVIFSRFEFALKSSGFLVKNQVENRQKQTGIYLLKGTKKLSRSQMN